MAATSERRTVILNAAARLFEHYGHAKTTIADVAREAQVGVGTVYLEFDSKDAIVAALSLSTHIDVLNAMRAARMAEGDHAERLTAVLLARTASFLRLGKKGQHACELLHCKTEAVKDAHRRFRAEEHALITSILDDAQRTGPLAQADPAVNAALVLRALASLSPPWLFSVDDDPMRLTKDLCELLVKGLLARAPQKSPTASRAGHTPKRTRSPTSTRGRQTNRGR